MTNSDNQSDTMVSQQSLLARAIDQFADDFLQILTEDPEIVKTAPHNTPVKRVDEVWAARNLILRHPIDEE